MPRLRHTSSGSARSRLADTDDGSEEGNTARAAAAAAAAAAGNINNEDRVDTTGWEKELSLEISRYEGREDNLTYKPGPLDDRQLRKAAQEFHKRWEKEESRAERLEAGEHIEEVEEDPLFVLVSRSCAKTPSDGMTSHALQCVEFDKLWYYLSDDGDLFITKLASGPCHDACVASVTADLIFFARGYRNGLERPFYVGSDGEYQVVGGRKAPDGILQRSYPQQNPPLVLRSPFVVELEIGHRGPRALMLQLEQYLQLPHSAYALGIKIYKKRRHLPGNPFAALAILWHKPPVPAGGPPPPIAVAGVWHFGTADLHPSSIRAFCTPPPRVPPIPVGGPYPPGVLPRPLPPGTPGPHVAFPPRQNPPGVINVPAASLVSNQFLRYSTTALVPNGNNLTIDLDEIASVAALVN